MNRNLFWVLVYGWVTGVACLGQSIDELTGFREIKFGSSAEHVKKLSGATRRTGPFDREGIDKFDVPGTAFSPSQLFELEIERVSFTYWQDQLVRIMVSLKDRVLTNDLPETQRHSEALDFFQPAYAGLVARYGKVGNFEVLPERGPLMFIRADWRGNVGIANLSLQFLQDWENRQKQWKDPKVQVLPDKLALSLTLASKTMEQKWEKEEAELRAAKARGRKDGL